MTHIWTWAVSILTLAAAASACIAALTSWRTKARFGVAIGTGIAASVLGFGWMTLAILDHRRAAYADFLRDCGKDHKQYECSLMWRASDRPDSGILPVIVPVPMPSR